MSPPLSIALVLSFTVSQLTKHFFFAFLCFSLSPLISPLLSQSFTLLQLATFSLPFSFFSASSPNLSILISIFLLFTVETSALTRETALETNKQWGYRTRWRAMASPYLTSPPKNWQSQGHCQSKMRLRWDETVKWMANKFTLMYSEMKRRKVWLLVILVIEVNNQEHQSYYQINIHSWFALTQLIYVFYD